MRSNPIGTTSSKKRKLNKIYLRWDITVLSGKLAFLRLLRPRFHLAISLGAALAVVLRGALHRRIVGHVFRDHRARPDIGAVTDFDGRDKRGIGADKGLSPIVVLCFEKAS